MSSTTTVAEFAAELNKPTATLIEQLTSAGVAKAEAGDHLSEADKQKLLSYLQASHGTATAERKKITLVKKTTTEIKQADSTGRARTIQVEVRKKRTFVKREDGSDVAVEDVVAAPQEPVVDNSELLRREEEARQHAELLRRQEEEFAEKCRLRDAQEALEAAREQERVLAELSAQAAAAAEAAQAAAAAEAMKIQKASAVKPVIGSRVFPDQHVVNAEAAAAAAVAAQAAAAVQAAKAAEISAAQAAVKAKATAEFQADAAKVQDFQDRRKKAEAEAAGIRAMMNAPKRVLVPHVDPKIAMKGTLHKPAVVPGAVKPVKPGAPVVAGAAGAAGKKEVKSENLSSTWKDDAKKKTELKTRGAPSAPGRGNFRGGPRGRRSSDRDSRSESSFVAPSEFKVIEVHVPETITVGELAHKMSVKSSEVIKH